MSDIIDEINYERTQEKITSFIIEHLFKIIILFIIILISSGLYIWNQDKTNKIYQNFEFEYNRVFDRDEPNTSIIKILNHIIEQDKNIYKQLSLIEKAKLLLKEKNNKEALSVYKLIYDNKKNDKIIQDIAKLFAVSVSVQNEEFSLNSRELKESHNKDNVFYWSILLSQIESLSKEKKYEEAVKICDEILSNYSTNQVLRKKVEKLAKIFKMKNDI